jgi:hypothetical protein
VVGRRAFPVTVNVASLAVLFAGVLSLVPTVLSAPTAIIGDSGVFYSVFHQLSQGRRLYVDVFDHKDPLFYAPHAVAYTLAGLPGPIIWETILSLALVGGAVLLTARLGVPAYARLPLAAAFAMLHFLPGVYEPLHTYHQGIVLVVVSLALAASGRPLLAGAVFGLAVLSKMPLAALLPALAALAVLSLPAASSAGAIRTMGHVLAGLLASLLVVLGGLLLRGEITGYGDAILQNLAYPSLSRADITSFRTGATLWERATTVYTAPLVWTYLALLVVSAGIVIAQGLRTRPSAGPLWTRPEPRAALLALAVGLGTFLMLRTASWWFQHFQIGALAFAVAPVRVMWILRSSW